MSVHYLYAFIYSNSMIDDPQLLDGNPKHVYHVMKIF